MTDSTEPGFNCASHSALYPANLPPSHTEEFRHRTEVRAVLAMMPSERAHYLDLVKLRRPEAGFKKLMEALPPEDVPAKKSEVARESPKSARHAARATQADPYASLKASGLLSPFQAAALGVFESAAPRYLTAGEFSALMHKPASSCAEVIGQLAGLSVLAERRRRIHYSLADAGEPGATFELEWALK